MNNEINYQELLIRSVRPNPENHFGKIEFVGEIDGKTVCFDPFVGCQLEWYQASFWIGKDVRFIGWKTDGGCFLISEVLEVK